MKIACQARNGYLYVKTTGQFSFPAAQKVFFEWVAEARRQNLTRILCDVTGLKDFDEQSAPAYALFDTAKFFAQNLPPEMMLAILEDPRQAKREDFGRSVMAEKASHVAFTSDLKAALAWLGVLRDAE